MYTDYMENKGKETKLGCEDDTSNGVSTRYPNQSNLGVITRKEKFQAVEILEDKEGLPDPVLPVKG